MHQSDLEMLDLIEHPVFVLEPDAGGVPRYATMNTRACRELGWARGDVIGKTATEVFSGQLGQTIFDHHVEAVQSGSPAAYEARVPVKGGERLMCTTLRPVFDIAGAVSHVIGSSVDVSGRMTLHEDEAELTLRTNEMQDFIELAAHDLRAPMRNVALIAEMLREDFVDLGDGKLELIDLLHDIGATASSLISDVLSHAQATSLTREKVRFDFSILVGEVLAVLDPMGTCIARVETGIIEGDRAAVQIILRNLIDNALKDARSDEETSKQVELDIRLDAREADLFKITIADNGKGFGDPALLFIETGQLRVDSGFGLLGVRRLIHARGGALKVSNRTGSGGAVVEFTLPGRIVSLASEEILGIG